MEPFRGMQLVSYHRSWNYLLRRHGLKVFDYIEPKETRAQRRVHGVAGHRMKRSGVRSSWRKTYQNRPISTRSHGRPAPGPRPPELRQRGPRESRPCFEFLRPDLRRARPRAASGQDVVVRPLLPLPHWLDRARACLGRGNVNVVATTEHYAAIARVIGRGPHLGGVSRKGLKIPTGSPEGAASRCPEPRRSPDRERQGLETAWLRPPSRVHEQRIREASGHLDASTGSGADPVRSGRAEVLPVVRTLVALQPGHSEIVGRRGHEQPTTTGSTRRTESRSRSPLDRSRCSTHQRGALSGEPRSVRRAAEGEAGGVGRPDEALRGDRIVSYHRELDYLARRPA